MLCSGHPGLRYQGCSGLDPGTPTGVKVSCGRLVCQSARSLILDQPCLLLWGLTASFRTVPALQLQFLGLWAPILTDCLQGQCRHNADCMVDTMQTVWSTQCRLCGRHIADCMVDTMQEGNGVTKQQEQRNCLTSGLPSWLYALAL